MATIGQAAERIRKTGQAAAMKAGLADSAPAKQSVALVSGTAAKKGMLTRAEEAASRDWAAYGVTGAERRERAQVRTGTAAPRKTGQTAGAEKKILRVSVDEERETQRRYNEALINGDMDTVREIDKARKAPETERDWAYGLTGTERRERQESVSRQLEDLKRQRMEAYRNGLFDPDGATRIAQKEKELRASVGQQTVGDRLESGGAAVVYPTVGAAANITGLAADTTMAAVQWMDGPGDRAKIRHEIDRYQAALDSGRTWDGTPATPEMREEFEEILKELRTEYDETEEPVPFEERHKVLAPALSKVRDEAYRVADQSRDAAAKEKEAAKEGLGKGKQLVVDAGIVGGQMGLDMLFAMATGVSSVIPMSVRTFGEFAQEARRDGATIGEQLVYGAGNAAIAAGTSLGAGKLKDLADREMILRLMLEAGAGKAGLAGAVGGLEGGVRTGLQSAWRRTYDPDAEIDWLSVRYNAAIGGMLGSANEGVKMAARWMARNGNRKSDGGQTKMPWTFSPDSKKTDSVDVRDQNQLLGNPGNAVPYYELDPNMPYLESTYDSPKGHSGNWRKLEDLLRFNTESNPSNGWRSNNKTGRHGNFGNEGNPSQYGTQDNNWR